MSAKKRKKKEEKPAQAPELEVKEMEEQESGQAPEPEKTDQEPAREPQEEAPGKKEKSSPADLRVVKCPVCGGEGEERKKRDKTAICKCSDCGLLFQNPHPSLNLLASQRNEGFQDAMVKPHGSEIREQSKVAVEVMKGFHKHTSGRPAALNSFGKNVLDVQCGLGFRLREFQRYGWEVYGADTSNHAVLYAKACALDARKTAFEAAEFKSNMFDLVLFCGNFGELPDPKQAVAKLLDILKPKGLVFIRQDKLDEESFSDLQLFYFDQDSMRRVLVSNGFEVVEEGQDGSGFLFWLERKK